MTRVPARDDLSDGPPLARLKLRITFGEAAMFGPGKAELLESIRDTGSISAAGRAMTMSYKRAWDLVEEMNAAFRDPLVTSTRGGPGGGGAVLTDAGQEVLRRFRSVEHAATRAVQDDLNALRSMLSASAGEPPSSD